MLTTTVHSLIESILGYGLTVTGSAATAGDLDSINQCILNPVARRVAGVGMSVRREVLYTLADMKTVHNHFILKAANVMDRILRAKGTQAQHDMQQFLDERQKPWKIWRPDRPLIQIKGSDKSAITQENIACWRKSRGKGWWQLNAANVRWWQLAVVEETTQTQKGEWEDNMGTDQSIYCAQAAEIDQDPLAEHLVFQFSGLRCWRDVAYKALRSLGWDPTCAFEDTIYPKRGGEGQINWDALTFPEVGDGIDGQRDDSLEVYLLECPQEDRTVMAIALVKLNEQWVWADIHILGKAVVTTSSVATGIALAVGLECIGSLLGISRGNLCWRGSKIKIYTDYAPLHEQEQRRRWQIYGAPREPSPEHTRLQVQLSNWSTHSKSGQLEILRLKDGSVSKTHAQKFLRGRMRREGWLEDPPGWCGRISALPMLQREVKDSLMNKQDMDEARAIAWLAEKPEESSVAGKIYQFWELDRQLIKDCHNGMKDDRGLQVTFNNLIGATRFKTLSGSRLMRAKCPKAGCGKVDSWEHFVQCYEAERMLELSREDKVKYMAALCKRIRTENPVRPSPTDIPYREDDGRISTPGTL